MGLPRTDADRIADYDAKVVPTTVGLKIASRLTDMKADYAVFANDFVAMQLLVRTELGTLATVFPITYGMYYAFAAQCWKLLKTTTQPAVDAVAQIGHDHWVLRGCDTVMMVQIAINVFSITVV